MQILIAEDTLLMRTMLEEWITSMGHTVLLAKDGEEAVELAAREPFDIAVIDWEMPKLNGMEVVKRLRAVARTAYCHIILITAHDEASRLIAALEGGADDFIRKPINPAELMARLRAGARIVEMRQEILRLANTDPLTGALNRRAFFQRAEEIQARARRTGMPFSVLVSDIDHFKRINDTHGHAAGDEALRRFAATCRSSFRPFDVLGRMGGEEFAMLLPDMALRDARSAAERLRTAVAGVEVDTGEASFGMTVSLGAAQVGADAFSIEPALAAADAALYRAKAGGRNRVELAE